MIFDERIKIKDYDTKGKLSNREIIIYGIGNDAKMFCEKYENSLNISFFLATNVEVNEFRGKPVVGIDKVLERLTNELIIICSSLYFDEMSEILSNLGLKGGEKYFIWVPPYPKAVDRFIIHEKKNNHIYTGKNIILVPVEWCHGSAIIMYKFCIRYFAEKYDAHPIGYLRQGGNKFESIIHPSVRDAYRAIGVNDIEIIDVDFETAKVNELFDSIIGGIHVMDDWQNISIDGFDCGISFLRDYLRFSELSFEPCDNEKCDCLKSAIRTVLFWKKYFHTHVVKTVILWDGVHNESYLRDLAIQNNINTYIMEPRSISKPFTNFSYSDNYYNFKKFFDELTIKEKEVGIKWAKKSVENILEGKDEAFLYRKGYQNVFNNKTKLKCIGENDQTKVLICPHIFNEDQWSHGEQLCGNNYISWLEFLGDISEKTSYDWYIKLHPDETKRGNQFISEYVLRYPKIKLIDIQISPVELKNVGFKYALTIAGSIGHEYPLVGIDVVNAGNNPHISFDFNINPKTKEEYKEILMNLEKYSALSNVDQIYEYLCIAYLYYKENNYSYEMRQAFSKINLYYGFEHSIYDTYISEYFDKVANDKLIENFNCIMDQIESRKLGIFYKKSDNQMEELLKSVEI